MDAELCSQLDSAKHLDLDEQSIYTWASDRVVDTLPALALARSEPR
jgi:hypothetical protein